MQLAAQEQCVSSEQARLLEPLQQGTMMSLVKDAAQVAELQAMQNGGLDSEPLQMMLRPTNCSSCKEKGTQRTAW